MRKLSLLSILLCVLLFLSACGDKIDTVAETPKGSLTGLNTPTTETSSAETSTEISTPDESETQVQSTATDSKSANSSKQSEQQTTPKNDVSSSTSTVQTPSDTSTSQSTVTTPKNASSSDAKIIADEILKYINQYRVAQGAGKAESLAVLTQVAQYRSNQLIKNYSHDTNDVREAARAFKYGEYIVYEEYGLDYYETHTGEAIGRSGGNASVNEIAERMAKGFKDSAAHWSYVGAARNKYIAVGASYGNGQWYICILTSEIDLSPKP